MLEYSHSPDHQGGGFHKGIRWNHGAVEPTVVELKDGTLWMLMRTSQDFHYQAFSKDGGQTWGESEPSPFYGTITMPTLGRLADGPDCCFSGAIRLLFPKRRVRTVFGMMCSPIVM